MKTELILPAGDLEKGQYALGYGADAIYLGFNKYSMRKAEVRFTLEELGSAINEAHDLKKKVYVTFNIFAHNSDMEDIEKDMKQVAALGPDAFIMSDLGIISLARKVAPQVPIHLSTQANTTNFEAVNFWKDFGIKRIVLARELSLEEIRKIHEKVPDIELEVFVHGSMCISYSGRCLLSAYMTGREANLGDCAQPCRWNYNVKRKTSNVKCSEEDEYVIEERMRPGEYLPIEESDRGTIIMSSKDLKLIRYLGDLKKAGVTGLKVEGRNKSIYYLSVVARSYRIALNMMASGKFTEKEILELEGELETVNHRDYTTGFVFGKAIKGEIYDKRVAVRKYDFIGKVMREQKTTGSKKLTYIEVRNQIKIGEKIEIVTPKKIFKQKVENIFDDKQNPLKMINPGKTNQTAYIELEESFEYPALLRKKL